MNILYVTTTQVELKANTSILPRLGDKVDMFYAPHPVVTSVLLHPKKDLYKDILTASCKDLVIDAIVTVE